MGIAVVKTALGVLAVLLLVSSASWATAPSPGPSAPVSSGFLTEFRSHIQHIVIVMMENHPYDNMFGDYCLAVGPYCPDNGTGYPSGLCVPLYPGNSTGPCAKPFPFTQAN
ncbi:MAG: hypothetical protein L3K08_07640, partial [Thermoplasmata archaeon]|nr:hypothetical protein [Thermoplasmata archaeon]